MADCFDARPSTHGMILQQERNIDIWNMWTILSVPVRAIASPRMYSGLGIDTVTIS